MTTHRRLALLLAAAMVACTALPALAQDGERPPIDFRYDTNNAIVRFQRRFSGQADVVQFRPVGELAQNIGLGYGVSGAGLMRLDDRGIVALRAELGFMQYGSERMQVPLSSTIGGRIEVDVTTSNDVITGGLGAQMMAPSGWFRPYVAGSAGFVSFATESSVQGSNSSYDFANTTNHQDTKFAWLTSAGAYVPLRRGKSLVSLDVGVTYHVPVGAQSYLKPGSIHDLPSGEIAIDPMYSESKFLTYRIGVSIGYR